MTSAIDCLDGVARAPERLRKQDGTITQGDLPSNSPMPRPNTAGHGTLVVARALYDSARTARPRDHFNRGTESCIHGKEFIDDLRLDLGAIASPADEFPQLGGVRKLPGLFHVLKFEETH